MHLAPLAPGEADFRSRYLAGPTWIYFVADDDLGGLVLFGGLDDAGGRAIVDVIRQRLRSRPVSRFLIDERDLGSVTPGAFMAFGELVRDGRALLEGRMEKVAMVHSGGFIAAIASGFVATFSLPFTAKTFDDVGAALTFLDVPERSHAALLDALAAARDSVEGESPLLRNVRALVRAELGGADLAAVARRLGMARRTLQRRLRSEGTSFQNEIGRAQVAFARERLRDSDDKLTAIALDAGCRSLQHFSALFKKRTGETPSAFRARTRAH